MRLPATGRLFSRASESLRGLEADAGHLCPLVANKEKGGPGNNGPSGKKSLGDLLCPKPLHFHFSVNWGEEPPVSSKFHQPASLASCYGLCLGLPLGGTHTMRVFFPGVRTRERCPQPLEDWRDGVCSSTLSHV